ncbi:MAG TPA: hypothetical protein VGS11_12095 [Candidatus Bathyarchaeia archaeon]|nr:hypothetical protein [Candidatus Bathyarchaeia archaeon]
MNQDFFKMARLVIENTGMKSDASFMDEVELLIKTVAPMYGSTKRDLSFFDTRDLGLEEVMTLLDIDSKLFFGSMPGKFGQYESRQTRVLKDILARTLDEALIGPLCRKHLALAKQMRPGDLVLSFNYDILMDNALFRTGKLTDSGYWMNFFQANEDETWIPTNDAVSDVTLLKLHGSLNWTKCGRCGVIVLYHLQKQVRYGAIRFHCPRCKAGDTFAQRLMIPPTQSKDYQDENISFLWYQADVMMKNISHIVCIGYSFPYTDFDMLSLMRRFRARQPKAPEIDFVSPDQDARNRMKNIMSLEKISYFDNLSSYLDLASN